MKIPEVDFSFSDEMLKFKKKLIFNVIARFTTSPEKGLCDDEGKPRRGFSIDVCNAKTYMMASMLDPRIKLTPFKRK